MIVYMIHGGKLVEACLPELRLGGGFMLDKIVEKKVIKTMSKIYKTWQRQGFICS